MRACASAWPPVGRSLSMAMLTCPFQTCSGVRFGAAWTVERLAPWVRVGVGVWLWPPPAPAAWVRQEGSYLVDPASSHMLVSKIKPCMSKYKLLYTVKLRMAH